MNKLDPNIDAKLYYDGAELLSVQQLMSLIIGKSNSTEDCFSVAERIISDYGNNSVLKLSVKALGDLGLTDNQAVRVKAACELGKRFYHKPKGKFLIRGPEDVYLYCSDMHTLVKEHFRILCVNTKNYIIRDEVISIGHLSGALVHPREVFIEALKCSASSIIVVHNHPSGDPEPSKNDDKITTMLKEAGNIMNIPVTDHVIIGEDAFYSYNEKMKI